MRVLQQVPAHFMRVCVFALLLARPVLPYDLDPGAMLNVCKMGENKKTAKTSEGSERYRCFDVLLKLSL